MLERAPFLSQRNGERLWNYACGAVLCPRSDADGKIPEDHGIDRVIAAVVFVVSGWS